MSNELVSAVLDGECSASEIDRFLINSGESAALMQKFSRMSLVRDALAGIPVPPASRLDAEVFCAGVMAQLGEMEPAAPATSMPARQLAVALPLKRAAAPRRTRRSRPMVGWAAAASVTLVAMVGGRAWVGHSAEPLEQTNTGVAANDAVGTMRVTADSGSPHFGLMPVSSRSYTSVSDAAREIHWTHLDPQAAQELADLMSEHSHLRLEPSRQGYAQYAGLGASYQTVSDPR